MRCGYWGLFLNMTNFSSWEIDEKQAILKIHFGIIDNYFNNFMCHPCKNIPIDVHTVSVQFSCSVMSDFLRPCELQDARPPCPSPTPRVHPNPCPLSRWCHPTISSSVIPPPPALSLSQHQGLFKWVSFSQSGSQSIGVSASASVLPMNTQDWSPLGWIGWISLQSKGLSRVLSNTTVQKHQFFCTQLSL